MGRIALVLFALALLMPAAVRAGEKDAAGAPPPKPQGQAPGAKKPMDLSASQQDRIRAIHKDTEARMARIHADGKLTREQKKEKIRAIQREGRQRIEATLTPEQREKARAMGKERGPAGPGGAPKWPELTEAQRSRMKAIAREMESKTAAVRGDAKLTPEQKAEKLRAIRKEGAQRMQALLTPEQRQKMGGAGHPGKASGKQRPTAKPKPKAPGAPR